MAFRPPQTAYPAVFQSPMMVTPISNLQNKHDNYQVKCVHGMSIALIVLGTLCICVQIVDIIIGNWVSWVGAGIWSGGMTLIAGCLGVFSCQKRTFCNIVAFLVMSIIAAVLSVGPLTIGIMGSIEAPHCCVYPTDDLMRASTAMNVMMFCMAAANGLILIVSSAYACHGLCSNPSSNTGYVGGQVHYVATADGQQQMVIVPFGQPVARGLQMPGGQTELSVPTYTMGQDHPAQYDDKQLLHGV